MLLLRYSRWIVEMSTVTEGGVFSTFKYNECSVHEKFAVKDVVI